MQFSFTTYLSKYSIEYLTQRKHFTELGHTQVTTSLWPYFSFITRL